MDRPPHSRSSTKPPNPPTTTTSHPTPGPPSSLSSSSSGPQSPFASGLDPFSSASSAASSIPSVAASSSLQVQLPLPLAQNLHFPAGSPPSFALTTDRSSSGRVQRRPSTASSAQTHSGIALLPLDDREKGKEKGKERGQTAFASGGSASSSAVEESERPLRDKETSARVASDDKSQSRFVRLPSSSSSPSSASSRRVDSGGSRDRDRKLAGMPSLVTNTASPSASHNSTSKSTSAPDSASLSTSESVVSTANNNSNNNEISASTSTSSSTPRNENRINHHADRSNHINHNHSNANSQSPLRSSRKHSLEDLSRSRSRRRSNSSIGYVQAQVQAPLRTDVERPLGTGDLLPSPFDPSPSDEERPPAHTHANNSKLGHSISTATNPQIDDHPHHRHHHRHHDAVEYDWATFIHAYSIGRWDPLRTPKQPRSCLSVPAFAVPVSRGNQQPQLPQTQTQLQQAQTSQEKRKDHPNAGTPSPVEHHRGRFVDSPEVTDWTPSEGEGDESRSEGEGEEEEEGHSGEEYEVRDDDGEEESPPHGMVGIPPVYKDVVRVDGVDGFTLSAPPRYHVPEAVIGASVVPGVPAPASNPLTKVQDGGEEKGADDPEESENVLPETRSLTSRLAERRISMPMLHLGSLSSPETRRIRSSGPPSASTITTNSNPSSALPSMTPSSSATTGSSSSTTTGTPTTATSNTTANTRKTTRPSLSSSGMPMHTRTHSDAATSAAAIRWAAAHVSVAPLALPSPEHELTDPMRGVTATIPGSHPSEGLIHHHHHHSHHSHHTHLKQQSVNSQQQGTRDSVGGGVNGFGMGLGGQTGPVSPTGMRKSRLSSFWEGTQDVDEPRVGVLGIKARISQIQVKDRNKRRPLRL
ncbi:hypothetical protein NLI96_g12889 [Meripilus lineatus]|uniref:Uncharacterized protein n=1 Tax=Meripilus lineatus TaxID=2056292 RepID=A0AAD5UPA2_9APHY|nr:hypothetical protein NLI96_g12889 [Physisporinus lineatus]